MAILISVDNDRITAGIQDLTLDETAGVQNAPGDDDNDVSISYAAGTLSSALLDAKFVTYLNALFAPGAVEDAALGYAASVGGASSSDSFIQVTANAGETIDDLFFSIDPANPTGLISTVTSLTGEALYFHVQANTDFALLTTSATPGAGRVVASFYLDESADHLSAQVQIVTFEPLRHPDSPNNFDEAINFSDVLRVSAAGTLSFDFDNLASGNFLWVAIGSSGAGLLVTGNDLNVNDDPSSNKYGSVISGGSSDPSDTVNTSQGGQGATIGINSQHFTYGGTGSNKTDGSIADFTLVTGFNSLQSATQATGTTIQGINYSGYVNTTGAGLFISQLTGTHADMRVSLWEAGDDGNPATTTLNPETGFNYIGNQDTDSALNDDDAIALVSVTITRGNASQTFTGSGSGTGVFAGIVVTFENANTFKITGAHALDTISWSSGGTTFNRFEVQALSTTDAFDIGRIDIKQGANVSEGLGSHLFVEDDGPSLNNTGTQPSLSVDESNFALNDTKDFSGAFSGSFGSDGPAPTGSKSYALGINAGATGLTDSLSGEAVVLSISGGIVYGKTAIGGIEVFRVSVDADGKVTLDQSRAVIHTPNNGPNDSATLANDDLITLTLTYKDGDLDTASATIGIGQNINLVDDAPSAQTTGTEPSLTVDETNFAVDDTKSFAGAFSGSFGNDGGAASNQTTYALGINAGSTGLIDSLSGQAVVLSVVGGVVYGKTATSGLEVFRVSVDANGNVTLNQSRAVIHDPNNGPNDSETLAADNLVTLTATYTDKDGDTANATINIGQNLNLVDDAPTSGTSGNEPNLSVDESNFATDDTKSFAGAFTGGFGNDGAAASDATTYALGIKAGSTGLVDSLSGEAVVLSVVSGVVYGKTATGGEEVFRVSVDANGNVTLNQSRAVIHDPNNGPNDSETLAADDLVTLTRTLTDKDGDQASSTVNIGQNLALIDDIPTVTLDRVASVFATVDETDLAADATVLGSSLLDPTINYGADGSGTAVYSLDVVGAGLTSLTTTDGQAITLSKVDSTTVEGRYGANLVAFQVTIDAGKGDVTLDQRVALHHPDDTDHDDSLYLDAGVLNAVLTVTDKDGDSASNPADIGPALEFKDDGPSVTGVDVSVIVDDDGGAGGNDGGTGDDNALRVTTGSVTALFEGGADGLKTFTISLANLVNPPVLTSQGQGVVFSQTGDLLTGYVDTDGSGAYEAANDRQVFTFELNAGGVSGAFAFTLIDQIDHATAGTEDNVALDLGILLQAVDGDDDTSDAAEPIQLAIDIDDDSPEITEQISDGVVDGDAVGDSITNSLNGAVGFDENDGNDETGAGVKTYTFTSFTTPHNAWPNLVGVQSTDGTTINFYESGAAGADLVYSIVLSQDGSGEYTFTVHKQTTAQKLEFDFADLPSGQNLFGVLVDRDDGGVLQVDGKGLLVVGRDAVLNGSGSYTNVSDTINTSKGGGGVTIGVDNQMFDPGDGAVFVFLNNPDDKSIGGAGLTQNTADDADTLGFAATYNTRSAELEVVQKQGSAVCSMKITAYNVDVPGADETIVSANDPLGASPPATDDVSTEARAFIDNPLNGATIISIDSVKVFDRANPGVMLLDATINQATGAITFSTKATGYGLTATQTAPGSGIWTVTVTGFDGNDSIVYTTAGDHDAVLTEGTSGKWDLGGVNLTENVDLPDQVFDFSVAINDYDGDNQDSLDTVFASFSIGVDGTGDADDGTVGGVDATSMLLLTSAMELKVAGAAGGDMFELTHMSALF